MEGKYTIKVICKHWSCGDGCCSDSWYYYELYDLNGIALTDWYSDVEIRSKDSCLTAAYEYAEQHHNIKDRDLFNVEYDDNWGDDEAGSF